MQLLPNELALANLKQEIPSDERGYCSVDEAYEWLKELSGMDFGFDINKWETWVAEQNKSVPSKLGKTTIIVLSEYAEEDNGRSVGD